MTVLDADFDIDLAPAEGDEVPLQVSVVVPERQPPDWASLLKETEARVDEEWARANVAELRREELRRSEREARSVADSLTRQLETCRAKLKMAAPKTLTGTVKALERRVESQDEEIAGLRLSQRRSWEDAERTEARHQDEINWLKQDLDKARSQIAKVFQEGERVAGSVRRQFERQLGAARRLAESREGTIAWLRERNDRLRAGVARATALIASLRESNRGLRAEVRDLKDENAAVSARADRLQAELDKLRSTRSVLSKALFGSRSEKQGKKGTGRSRGQQQGSTGHGRTKRTGLGKRKERHEPPQDDRVCPRCGKPYAANGHHCSTIFEVDVEAWERTIIRPRYRPTCDCAPPQEVTAPPATRLFENTAYGISVWTCMLYERFVCLRPLSRVAAWLADMGLPISPGTLADSIKRFVPPFQPLAEAILAHQNEATLRQADETSWRVQEYRRQGRSGRAWLWTSISDDAVFFHVDPSRSAKVAMKLFESVKGTVVLVKSGRYFAPPVRRHYIPKAGGTKRPLGIPTFEDKVAQRAIVMILEPIYETDFLPCSYGFRPGRSAHDALDALRNGIMEQRLRWVIDADLARYFDSIPHSHLRSFLDLRIKDGVIRRMLDKWLKAGVLDQGVLQRSETGTPQGGVVSPLLSNVFLHYVLDKWFEAEVRPRLRGRCQLVRYADDAVMTFANEQDGRRMLAVLGRRLARYGLTLHETKTRYVDFRPRLGGGHDPDATFDFLGFNHVWTRSRKDNPVVRQITARDRFARAVKAVHDWCKTHRHEPLAAQHEHLARVIRGHCNYYGRIGNSARLSWFRSQMAHCWRSFLSRRSNKGYVNWDRMNALLRRFPLPLARIRSPDTSTA